MKPTRTCTIDGCDKKHRARGWCDKHYQRWKFHGNPLTLLQKQCATPEESFATRTEWRGDCLIWTGGVIPNGYGTIKVDGKSQYAHRYAWERVHGPIPKGLQIDHRYHCSKLCVNVDHLRTATHSQNLTNRSGPTRHNSTGVRNVSRSWDGRYSVLLKKEGVEHYFGRYLTIEEAATVAEQARRELFGEFAGRG